MKGAKAGEQKQNKNMVLRWGLVFCWLNKLRNTQGKIYGTYLGNIHGI